MVEGFKLSETNIERIEALCDGLIVTQHDPLDYDKTSLALNVPTVNGVERAQIGDLVIRDDDGLFHVRKN